VRQWGRSLRSDLVEYPLHQAFFVRDGGSPFPCGCDLLPTGDVHKLEDFRGVQKPGEAGKGRDPAAVPLMGHGQEELLLGTGDGDVEQTPLFLLVFFRLIAVRYGEVAVRHPHDEDRIPFQPLGRVDGREDEGPGVEVDVLVLFHGLLCRGAGSGLFSLHLHLV
jgi:hypothetical protein